MIQTDVTLNVILDKASCRTNVTLAHVRRRTNVTLASIHVRPNVTPGPTDVILGQIYDRSNVTPDLPTSPRPLSASPSRPAGRIIALVSGESRRDVSDPPVASASRGAVRRRHGDAQLRRRLNELGSITELHFLARPAATPDPARWPGISALTGQRSGLVPTPLRMGSEPVSGQLWPFPACAGRGQWPGASEHAGPVAPPIAGRNTIARGIPCRSGTDLRRRSAAPLRPPWPALASLATGRAPFASSAVAVAFQPPP
jgi:hypothetical protein